jgi:hypothetical protein
MRLLAEQVRRGVLSDPIDEICKADPMRATCRAWRVSMKTFLFALILSVPLAMPLRAQFDRPIRYFPYPPTGGCSALDPMWNNYGSTNGLYRCGGGGWQLVGATSAFSGITPGVNLGSLVMGSNGSMNYTGSGYINANRILGPCLPRFKEMEPRSR